MSGSSKEEADERVFRRFEAFTLNTQLFLEYLRTSLVLLTAGFIFVGFTRRDSDDARIDFVILVTTALAMLIMGTVSHWQKEKEIETDRFPRHRARYGAAVTAGIMAVLYVTAGAVFFFTWHRRTPAPQAR